MKIGDVYITCALDVREAARRFYPANIHLQRKWVRAWRLAPGARVRVGKLSSDEHLRQGRDRAVDYLRCYSKGGYAMDRRALPKVVEKPVTPPPQAHRIRRVK